MSDEISHFLLPESCLSPERRRPSRVDIYKWIVLRRFTSRVIVHWLRKSSASVWWLLRSRKAIGVEGSWCPDVVFCRSLLLRGRMRLHALMLMVVVGMLYDRPVYARHREGASYHNSHPVHHNERNEEIHDQMRWVHEIRARVDSGEIQDGYKITKSGILYKLFGLDTQTRYLLQWTF